MTDYFALLEEARRPWLDPEELKEKYFARSRAAAADAELNEAFRVLSDPKLRLHHLLTLEGAELTAGRPVPPSVAELFWNTGTLLRDVERWLLKSAAAGSALSRALLSSERTKLERKLEKLEEELNALYETGLDQLRQIDSAANSVPPNELSKLVELYDSISYLTRLREQTTEKRFQLGTA
jgi:curved DNA-binding protein CbpA